METRSVTQIANDWEVSEYEIFRRAAEYYYGQPAREKEIEKQYGLWMNGHLKLPVYVTYYLEHWIFLA